MHRILLGLSVCLAALVVPSAIQSAPGGGGGGRGGGGGGHSGGGGGGHSGGGAHVSGGGGTIHVSGGGGSVRVVSGSGVVVRNYAPGRSYYGRGYFGPFYGYGDIYLGYGGGYGYPYGYSSTYPSSYPDAYAPSTLVTPSPYVVPPTNPSVPSPGEAIAPPAPTPIGNTANIRVILPTEDAKMFVDGAPTSSTGGLRTFATPELKPGEIFHYELTVSWDDGGSTISVKRRINVTSGATTVVDFTKPAPRP